jgi:hypothetical protein
MTMSNAPWQTQDWSERQKLDALAAFVPVFSHPKASFGTWAGGEENNGILTMPWFSLTPEAERFVQVLYDYGYVRDFDWPSWAGTAEAAALRADPDALALATMDQLERLLTCLARADRLAEGTLAEAFDSGLLLRIAQRAAALAAQSG